MKIKKILIITNYKKPNQDVTKIISHAPKNIHIDQTFWNDILYFYDGKNKHIIFFRVKGSTKLTKITDYDIVYIRPYIPLDLDIIPIIIREAQDHNIKIVGYTPYIGDEYIYFKAGTMNYTNKKFGMIYPRSFFGHRKLLLKNYDTIVKKCGLPFVCKPNNMSKGRGVSLIKSKKGLEKYFEDMKIECRKKSYFLIQKHIPNDGDYRVLAIGKDIYTIKRTSQNNSEFRNNISLGGNAEKQSTPPEIKKLVHKITRTCKLDFTGIDYIKKGKQYIFLEINRTPGLIGVSSAHEKDLFKKTLDLIITKIKK